MTYTKKECIEISEIQRNIKKDDIPFIIDALCECGFKFNTSPTSLHCQRY